MSDPGSLLGLLASGATVCRVTATGHADLLTTLFLAGLVGSASHCAGMCGPFVLSQVAARLEMMPASHLSEWRRLGGGALVSYHLGRATTYIALGAAVAGAAEVVAGWGGFRYLASVLLLVAAVFMVGMAAPQVKAWLGMTSGSGSGWWDRSIGRWARPLLENPAGGRGWLLGVALGFIPCGLLWGALAAAAASGDAIAGAMALAAFWLGTVPMLLVIGVIGHAAAGQWRQPIMRWAPVLLVINAGVLGVMAVGMLG